MLADVKMGVKERIKVSAIDSTGYQREEEQ